MYLFQRNLVFYSYGMSFPKEEACHLGDFIQRVVVYLYIPSKHIVKLSLCIH